MRPRHWLAAGVLIALCVPAVLLVNGQARDAATSYEDDPKHVRAKPVLLRDEQPTLEPGAQAPASAPRPGEAKAEALKKRTFHVTVRDAFDGRVIPALDVLRVTWVDSLDGSPRVLTRDARRALIDRLQKAERLVDERLRSDDRGGIAFDVDPDLVEHTCLIHPGAAWETLNPYYGATSGILWVYRSVKLELRVQSDSGSFRLVVPELIFIDSNHWEAKRPKGIGDKWFSAVRSRRDWRSPTDIAPFRLVRRSAGTREYEVALPRIKGVLVRAAAVGFLDAAMLLHPPADHEDTVLADLTLRPAPLIAGRVVDETGNAVDGARLLVRVVVPYPDDPDESGTLMAGIGSGRCVGAGGKTDPHMRFEREIHVDPKTGAFRHYLPIEGKLTLHASKKGHEPVKAEYGMTTRDRTGLELILVTLRGPVRTHAKLVRGDESFGISGMPLELWKLEDTAVTDVVRVHIDSEGRIPVDELERGMRYLIKPGVRKIGDFELPKYLGDFVWHDEDVIDLSASER